MRKIFCFSYGSANPSGNEGYFIETNEKEVDFKFKPEAYGFAFPVNGDEKNIYFEIFSTGAVKANVEFKTVRSCGAAEFVEKFNMSNGMNYFEYIIPELTSPLKEIVIAIFLKENSNLESVKLTFETVEIK